MKRCCTALLLLLLTLSVSAIEKSTTKVFINGTKYYIHAVEAGETLYALSKTYAVSEELIRQHNPSTADGLKAGAKLRIPVVEEQPATAPTEQPRSKAEEKKLKKTFATHYVARGETLYAIARRYEIAVKTIIEDNPSIDPAHLSLNQELLIRKKQIGKSSEEQAKAQWEAYTEQLNSVAPEGEDYYVVQAGDTFYSLARRAGITTEELSALNDGLQPTDLKAGAIIKLPDPNAPAVKAEEEQQPTLVGEHPSIDFRAHCNCDPLRVALLLPLTQEERANENYLAFYRGFLLGLDSVRTQYGHSIDLNLFDTKRSKARIEELVEHEAVRTAQLIVGPVYEEEMEPIVRLAEEKQIPVVSPLAHMTRVKSDVLFQMAPDPTMKYNKADDLIAADKRITLIYTERTDKAFEQEMLALLGDRTYEKYQYEYVHPSVKLKEGEINPSDLSPLLQNDDEHLFIVMADNEIEVDRILAALASADTNIRARSLGNPNYRVIGNSRWNRYNNIDRTIFFKNRVVFFTTYHAKRDNEQIVGFDRAYLQAFGSLPSLYAYRGYDAAMIFTRAMFNDIEYDLEDRRYEPLQTRYRFEQEEPTANHNNTNWVRVNYHNNFTISIE